MTLQDKIEFVKTSEATRMFWDGVKTYGNKGNALRAYDSKSELEAIEMLKNAVKYSIFKLNGEVIVQAK